MAKQKERIVGTGITARTQRTVEFDFVDPGDFDMLRAHFNAFNQSLFTPWGVNAFLIETVRAELARIEASAPDPRENLKGYNTYFKEHESKGWYLKDIVTSAAIAESAVEEGRPWEAVTHAMLIGQRLAELRLKMKWEPAALTGQSSIEGARYGVRQRKAKYADRDVKLRAFYSARAEDRNHSAALRATMREFDLSDNSVRRILRQK